MTLGTINYAAPEQLMGEDIDARADQYALAATVYHLVTGNQLFDHSNPAVVISRHLTADPPRLFDTRRELGALDVVLSHALAKAPNDRFTTCMQFARALRGAVGGLGRPADSAERTPPAQQPSTAGSPDPAAPTQLAPVTGSTDDTQFAPIAAQPPAAVADRGAPPAKPGPAARRPAIIAALIAVIVVHGVVAAIAMWPSGSPQQASDDPTTEASAPSTAPSRTVASPAPPLPLPPSIAASGRLVVGTNVPYAPAEFKDAAGRLSGFDIDLINAVASELAVRPEYRELDFSAIIPSVSEGSIDVGAAAMTDTCGREQVVDMVTYYNGGIIWAQRPGAGVDPNNACGLRIGVQRKTIQETEELPAKSQACVNAGRPAITAVSFESQDQVTNALMRGQVDAMTADSAVTGYAIKLSDGCLQQAGELFDHAPWGWAVAKGSPLTTALQQALTRLMRSGQYEAILRRWGVEAGAITTSVVNGAIN